jgi:uncharacterized protein (UPF0335 family)
MANENFKFPDEIENEKENNKDDSEDDLVVDVTDDTPEQDRDKTPMSENAKKELYDDELEDYSTKVKKKILAMKRLAHEERREKESILREHQEAIAVTQKIIEENKRLKSSLNTSEKTVIESIKKSVELEFEQAKRAYREAYDSGDTDRVMEAQEKLTDLSLKKDKVNNFRPKPLQDDEIELKTPPRPAERIPVDTNAQAWQRDNTWFGEDKLMTGMALALHEQLKEEGVALSSQEYYRRINQTMRHRFPEKFEDDKSEETRTTRHNSVVAPASRSTSSKRVSLTKSQLSIAKKLNLTPEQYAREQMKLES